MKRQNCINCIFSSWYGNFKQITFRSKIIKLSCEFVEYLKSDGIVLPDLNAPTYSNELEGYSDEDDNVEWDEQERNVTIPEFPELQEEVEAAIKSLGGEVFPKLNWSSPKDAAWMSHNGTLKCTNFSDVCLLLKSSDFVTNDLTNAYKFCEDDQSSQPSDQFELVLRKYISIVPGMEFRGFVKNNKLVGISQRHYNTFFDYLVQNKEKILRGITNFFNSRIKDEFAESNYTFDVYINSQNRFYVLDFNPFGELTDALLFTWDELNGIDNATNIDVDSEDFFRIVTESNNIQPSPYMRYGMPTDVVDLACGEDIQKMIDFLNVKELVVKPGENVEKENGDEPGT